MEGGCAHFIGEEAEWNQSLLGGSLQAGRSGAPQSKTSPLPHPSPSRSFSDDHFSGSQWACGYLGSSDRFLDETELA